jgi:hypothetical protein
VRKLTVACSAEKGAAAASASRRDLVVGIALSSLALAAPSWASSSKDDALGVDLAKKGSVKASRARKDALKEKYANVKAQSDKPE